MTKILKSEVLAYGNFSISLLYAFQKQIQSIIEVHFITKFLMDLKYTWNILLEIIF